MTDTTVVFVQRGFPPFLKYCVEQAKACGYRTIVLGDDEVGRCVDAEFYNIENFSGRSQEFAKIYNHIGSNSYDYELFCFQRWFIIRDLMDNISGDLIVLDSDVLAYKGIDYLKKIAEGKKFFNVPWVNYFRDRDCLDFYINFVNSVYADSSKLKVISEKYVYAGVPQMSDMYLFYEIGDQFPEMIANMRDFGPYLGIDNCVRDLVGFQGTHHHKNVVFKDGIPYCDRDVGGETRFFTFHFQGISKPLMQYMHTIFDSEALAKLDDLSFWFELPGHKEIHGWEDTLSAYKMLQSNVKIL